MICICWNAGNFPVSGVFPVKLNWFVWKRIISFRDPWIKLPLCIYDFFLLSWVSGWTQVTQVVTESKDESSGRHHFTLQIGTACPCEHFRRFTCQMTVLSAFHTSLWIRLSTNFSLVKTSCPFYTVADKAVHVISGANSRKAGRHFCLLALTESAHVFHVIKDDYY